MDWSNVAEKIFSFFVGFRPQKLGVVVPQMPLVLRIILDNSVPNVEGGLPLLPKDREETNLVQPLQILVHGFCLLVFSALIHEDQIFHVSLHAGTVFLQQILKLRLYFIVVPG